MHRRDEVAGIVGSNDMSCRAVLTRIPKAEGGSWHKVGARRVDRGINGGELVSNSRGCVNKEVQVG